MTGRRSNSNMWNSRFHHFFIRSNTPFHLPPACFCHLCPLMTAGPPSLWMNAVFLWITGNTCSHHVWRRPVLCCPECIALPCVCTSARTRSGWTLKPRLPSRGAVGHLRGTPPPLRPGLTGQSFASVCEGKKHWLFRVCETTASSLRARPHTDVSSC